MRKPGLISLSPQRNRSFSAKISLILPDIHIVKLGYISGLYFDHLRHFSAGEDPIKLEAAEDGVEAALVDLEPVSRA